MPNNPLPVPIEEWGKDHWSTLAYIETACVDHKGRIANERMRCNWRLHRKLAAHRLGVSSDSKSPTILRGGRLLHDHDDWSCVEDLCAAGFVGIVSERDLHSSWLFGGGEIRVKLTPEGVALASALRLHKQAGGSFGTFVAPAATTDNTEEPR